MSAAIIDEPTTDPADIAHDQLEELARFVVILALRRREYCEQYDCYSHQLLLRMEAMGLKTIDIGKHTIRLRPQRQRFSPSQRRAARRWNFGAILGNDGLPPRISVERKKPV